MDLEDLRNYATVVAALVALDIQRVQEGFCTFLGDPETISYINDTGANQPVYLVVDSYGTDSCGTFTGDITINGGVVGVEIPSWSEVKARF